MISPDGRPVQIPYSKVHTSLANNYLFGDKQTLRKYANDQAADPLNEDRIQQFEDKHPWLAAIPAGLDNYVGGIAKGLVKTATGMDRLPQSHNLGGRLETAAQMYAATPTKGVPGAVGEGAENVAEYFGGEELLGLLGKASGAMSLAEKMKSVTGLAQVLDKYPLVAKVLKIGSNAVKQGTIAGGQTYIKSGGDSDAAARTSLEAAGIGAGLEGVVAPVVRAGARLLSPTAAPASTGAAEIAAEARGAVEPHLNAINESRRLPEQEVHMNQPSSEEGVMMNQPGGAPAVATGRRVTTPAVATGTFARPTETPQVDVNAVLNKIHDFTGAADRLAEVNNAGYDALDALTGNKFRALNGEVAAAQKAAYAGGEEAAAAYRNKLAEMNDLMDSVKGKIGPDELSTLKASWRQSYQLRDFGNIWDKALNGVPGATQVSQEQAGVNGRVLMKGLQQAVRNYGRDQIDAALGTGRLENLERIARLNTTAPQRAAFNKGLHVVGSYLPIWVGAKIGEHVAGLPGEIAGGMVGAAAKPTVEKVLNAVRANPQIGQFFTHAVEYGASPKVYGPMLAEMIQKSNTEASRDEQDQNDQQHGGDQ